MIVEEVDIGLVGGDESIPISKLKVVDMEIEVTPEGDNPLDIGVVSIAPAIPEFLGVASRVPTAPVVATAQDLLVVHRALDNLLPTTLLSDPRVAECVQILEHIGLVVVSGGVMINLAGASRRKTDMNSR